MKFQLENGTARYRIASYGPGEIRVNDLVLTGTFALSSEVLMTESMPATPSALRPEHLLQLLDLGPEVVLLGGGRRQFFPDPTVTASLFTRGIGLEFMDTGAACRTFNILIAESRRVAALLFMIEGDAR